MLPTLNGSHIAMKALDETVFIIVELSRLPSLPRGCPHAMLSFLQCFRARERGRSGRYESAIILEDSWA